MAVTFPLSSTVFSETLGVTRVIWQQLPGHITSGSKAGSVITSEIATPKWKAQIELAIQYIDDARKPLAMLRRIGPHNPFYLHNPAIPYPRSDPTGSILGSSTVTIASISGREVTLTGLPAFYALKWGDMFSVNFGSNPLRTALYEVNEDVSANGSGTTSLFEVTPPPKAGMIVGSPVRLKKPIAKMRLINFDPGASSSIFTDGAVFEALESI